MNEVYIYSAVRTPIGSFGGKLAGIPATTLGGITIREAVSRAGIASDHIDEVFMGQVVQANAGQAPARQAALGAGLSTSVPCTTVNKVCASGMKAVMLGKNSVFHVKLRTPMLFNPISEQPEPGKKKGLSVRSSLLNCVIERAMFLCLETMKSTHRCFLTRFPY